MLITSLALCADTTAATNKIPPTHADLSYGPHERNVLDLFLAESVEPTPLVLYIHGGGFRGGDKSRLKQSSLKSFLQAGYSVASLNYRLTNTAPAPAAYLDCGRAIQFLRHHADQWNLDPDLVASTGGSAGAGTSLWLAFHDDLAEPNSDDPIARESTRLTCVAVTNGQSSYDPRFAEAIGLPRPNFEDHAFFLPFYGISKDEIDTPKAIERYQTMAPITHLTKDDPPALMDYGRANVPVDASSDKSLVVHHPLFGIALKERMDKLGVECVVQYLDVTGKKKVRHTSDGPILTQIAFIKEQFARARAAQAGMME
jgi:acetyl esterase/lipase